MPSRMHSRSLRAPLGTVLAAAVILTTTPVSYTHLTLPTILRV